MKKIIASLITYLGFISSTFAQPGGSGFSTFRLTWTSTTAVPTISTYGAILLALLLALAAFRVLRSRGPLVRAIIPLATFGIGAAFAFMTENPIAGSIVPPIDGSSCSGSQVYTADEFTAPPCFINTCGSPVQISYTFVAGKDFSGADLSSGTCTYNYYCDGATGATVTQGGIIPSDGESYPTAYCQEILAE